MDENEWMRASAAAEYLGVSRERIRQLVAAGLLESQRVEPRQVWIRIVSLDARKSKARGPVE